jgi:hypothetical protein
MGNIIAVVAVLLIHIEMNAEMAPYASKRRPVLFPTQRKDMIP